MSQNPNEPIDVQRILMDRARSLAERDQLPQEKPLAPRIVGLGLALLVVVVVLFAFDRFLAAMQRFMGVEVTAPAPAATEPVPAYAVPAEPTPEPVPGQAPATEAGAEQDRSAGTPGN